MERDEAMTGWKSSAAIAAAWLVLPALALGQVVEWGGVRHPRRTQNLSLRIGAVTDFEGLVVETTRRVYEVTGDDQAQQRAQTMGTSDFDLSGPFAAAGLSIQGRGRFLRIHFDTLFLKPSVSSVARRDYYLSLGSKVDYEGRRYDRMMIPEGSPFTAELSGTISELNLSLVPVGFRMGERVAINPALEVGVVGVGGYYDIDAGEPTGVVQYLNPPEPFVVGGRATGFVGMGTVQWGPALEVRVGRGDGVVLDMQAQYLFFDYAGSTAFFTSADHRRKGVDFQHRNLRLGGQVEFPLRRGAWHLGVQAQWVESEGTISSTATDREEILARRERFDKEFNFKMQSLLAIVGVTF